MRHTVEGQFMPHTVDAGLLKVSICGTPLKVSYAAHR
jgi:hypothetical protein